VSAQGDLVGHAEFCRVIEVDEATFIKLYQAEIKAFYELTNSAMKVFGYLVQELKPNKDKFFLSMQECLTYTQYKNKKDVYEGITGLLEAGIIARGLQAGEYFINPLICFNGNRARFAREYVKKKKTATADLNQLPIFDPAGVPATLPDLQPGSIAASFGGQAARFEQEGRPGKAA
jgi:hypothetical protein